MSVWDELPRGAAALSAHVGVNGAPHATLLLGASPSLKRAAALAFGASLNCPVAPGEGCGTCSSCARTMRNRHPDVHYIAPEGAVIGVDVIRETLISEAARSPFEARFKVFVVEEAERMHPSAQNALLKTLEEPQPDTFFVLTCEREVDLLDTIFSRCRIVRLAAPTEDEIAERLVGEGVPDDLAHTAARVSEGDLERARLLAVDPPTKARRAAWLSLPDQLRAPADALDAAAEMMDGVAQALKDKEGEQKQEIAELAEATGERRGTAQAKNALVRRHRRELRRLEEDLLGEAFATLGAFYRDVVALRRAGEKHVLNTDALDGLRRWESAPLTDAELLAASVRCVETRAALATNANTSLAVEAGLVALARITQGVAAPAR